MITSQWSPHILLTINMMAFVALFSPNSYKCFARHGSSSPNKFHDTYRKLMFCLDPIGSSCPIKDSPISARTIHVTTACTRLLPPSTSLFGSYSLSHDQHVPLGQCDSSPNRVVEIICSVRGPLGRGPRTRGPSALWLIHH